MFNILNQDVRHPDPGLTDTDRAEYVIGRRDVHVPVRQADDDLLRRFRAERLGDLPGGVHEELCST